MAGITVSVFADKIIDGSKTQTIRRVGKKPRQCGDKLHFYTDFRTKHQKLIGIATIISISPIEILANGDVILGDVLLNDDQKHKLAIADGFNDAQSFLTFFRETYDTAVFDGVVIRWDGFEAAKLESN